MAFRQEGAPEMYFYIQCAECDAKKHGIVHPCLTCAAITCHHLMHHGRCFLCIDATLPDWPDWHMKPHEGPVQYTSPMLV
jgi:hypothetical protein